MSVLKQEPEGLTELEIIFDEMQLFYGKEVKQALTLMRELAQALEYYSEAKVTVQDPMNEGIEMHISDSDVAKNILKKFREWK